MQANVALGHLFGSLISLDIIMYPNVNNLLEVLNSRLKTRSDQDI